THQGRRQQRSGRRLCPRPLRRFCAAPAAFRNQDAVVMGRTGADPAARGLGTRPVLSPRRRNRDPAAERRGAPAPSLAPRRNRAMMGGLAVALFGLTALALTMLLAPLFLRRRGPASREVYSLAVYRDQLAEVERDLARGVLAPEHAEAARAEIARRILALKPAEAESGANPAGPMGSRAALTVVILVLPVAAVMLYGRLGS